MTAPEAILMAKSRLGSDELAVWVRENLMPLLDYAAALEAFAQCFSANAAGTDVWLAKSGNDAAQTYLLMLQAKSRLKETLA